jgi:hypothetical protein
MIAKQKGLFAKLLKLFARVFAKRQNDQFPIYKCWKFVSTGEIR